MNPQYIYLLIEREFIKTKENIFKIGKTKQLNNIRFSQYPKESILLLQISCYDCDIFEKNLINIFKEKFINRKDIGNEYFQGDYIDMINEIYINGLKENKNSINNNTYKEYTKKDIIDKNNITKENIDVNNITNENINENNINKVNIDENNINKENIYNNISGNYSCKKCENFNSKNFGDLKKHIFKKYPCKKTNNSYLLSDDQILAISILPNNEFNSITIKETLHLKNSNIITKNKEDLFNIFKSIEKINQSSFCKFCNKEYKLILDLKKHLVLDCFYNDLKKKENNHEFTNIDINTTYNNS